MTYAEFLILKGLCYFWLFLFLILVFLSRNEDVCTLRIEVLKKGIDRYEKLPSYNRMIFSFKPLEEKYWIKEKKEVKK